MDFSADVFRMLLDKASDAILVTDPETLHFIYVNEAAVKMHGFSRDELLNMSVQEIDPNFDSRQVKRINKALSEDRVALFEGTHRRKDGSVFPVEINVSLVRVGDKDWRQAMVRDITERRKDETRLKLFRALIDRASDVIEVIDPETLRYLDVNETACRTLGYTREELLALSVWDIDTNMHSAPFDKIGEALEKGQAVRHESLHRRKDGSTFPVEVIISQVKLDKAYIIAVARNFTERKEYEEKIHTLAYHDALTKLPNRRLLSDRLQQTLTASKRSLLYGAVLYLDLDNFKLLNDTHGHDVGDLLLIEVARRITSCVREEDTVARLGGDEFVVVLGELDMDEDISSKQAGIVAKKIGALLAKPYLLKFRQADHQEINIEYKCTVSIGIAMSIGHDASPQEILRWADMAMYKAKETGRNSIRFYDVRSKQSDD